MSPMITGTPDHTASICPKRREYPFMYHGSTVSGPLLVAMSLTQKIAQDLHEKGEFDMLESSMKRIDAQQLFATRQG